MIKTKAVALLCCLLSAHALQDQGCQSIIEEVALADHIVIRHVGIEDKSIQPILIARTALDTQLIDSFMSIRDPRTGRSISLIYPFSFVLALEEEEFRKVDSVFAQTKPAKQYPQEYYQQYGSFLLWRFCERTMIQRLEILEWYNSTAYWGEVIKHLKSADADKRLIVHLEELLCNLNSKRYPCE